ncbi:MAG: hypothetical protein H6735_25390 [Alphaproteobacteria bacterium]|nr:hypothetical protein [Alphaproteobacteria bacterium]
MIVALPMLLASAARAEPAEVDVGELLAENRPRAQRWWWTWVGTFGALTVGQGVLAATASDPDLRAVDLIGAASSGIGVANLLVSPYPGRHARADLRAIGDDDAALLDLFERTAAAERFQTGWLAHVGGLVVSAAPAALIWVVYDQPETAALNLVGGVALSEAQILTSPRHVLRARRARDGLTATVVPTPSGLLVVGRF